LATRQSATRGKMPDWMKCPLVRLPRGATEILQDTRRCKSGATGAGEWLEDSRSRSHDG
jgi:hypothetical protein